MSHLMSSIVLDLLDCIKDDNTNTITNPGSIYLIDLCNFMATGTIAAWLYLALMFTKISSFLRKGDSYSRQNWARTHLHLFGVRS